MKVPQSYSAGFSLVLILVTISVLTGLVAILFPLSNTALDRSNRRLQQTQAQGLAEAGINKALHDLSYNANYTGESNYSLSPVPGTVDISIQSLDQTTNLITSKSYVPNKTSPQVTWVVTSKVQADSQASGNVFSFAVQTGAGGFVADSNAKIQGSIYSNKDISIQGPGANVTGNATAVGKVHLAKPQIVQGNVVEDANPSNLPAVDLAAWQQKATTTGTTHAGDLTLTTNTTLGGTNTISVITGKLVVASNITVTLAGPIWIKGGANTNALEISQNPNFVISSSLAEDKTVILTDKPISITGNASFTTNKPNAWVLLLSTYSDPNNPYATAINIDSNAQFSNAVVYAYSGALVLNANSSASSARAFVGQQIHLIGNTTIQYQDGLATVTFDSTGSGGFSRLPGTYAEPKP